MIVAVCVEERGGTMFNGRRLSRDRVQVSDLLALCGGRKLWASPYSAALFGDRAEVAEDPLAPAGPGEVCFLEGQPIAPALDQVESIVLYRWGRAYPADTYLDVDPAAEGFALAEQTEFPGSSHERICREIYERRADHG